jgi:hypothetical protein
MSAKHTYSALQNPTANTATQPAKLMPGELSLGKHDLGEGKGYIKVFKKGEATYAVVVFPDKFLDGFKGQYEAHQSAQKWLALSDVYCHHWVEVGYDDFGSPPFFLFQAFTIDQGKQINETMRELSNEMYDSKNK